MAAAKPPCRDVPAWLKGRYGRDVLAPLTGQDYAALRAVAHVVEAYCYSDSPGRRDLLVAFAALVRVMQPSTQWMAFAAIPCVADWGFISEIAPDVRELDAPGSVMRDWAQNAPRWFAQLTGPRAVTT